MWLQHWIQHLNATLLPNAKGAFKCNTWMQHSHPMWRKNLNATLECNTSHQNERTNTHHHSYWLDQRGSQLKAPNQLTTLNPTQFNKFNQFPHQLNWIQGHHFNRAGSQPLNAGFPRYLYWDTGTTQLEEQPLQLSHRPSQLGRICSSSLQENSSHIPASPWDPRGIFFPPSPTS